MVSFWLIQALIVIMDKIKLVSSLIMHKILDFWSNWKGLIMDNHQIWHFFQILIMVLKHNIMREILSMLSCLLILLYKYRAIQVWKTRKLLSKKLSKSSSKSSQKALQKSSPEIKELVQVISRGSGLSQLTSSLKPSSWSPHESYKAQEQSITRLARPPVW